jgi:antitoxin MazE
MQARVVNIGTSVGIILPNVIVKDFSLQAGRLLDISVSDDTMILRKKTHREGWALAAQKLHEEGEDKLLIPDVFEDEIFNEWIQ